MKSTIYFKDIDRKDTIVRKKADMFELEYISKRNPFWTKTTLNSSYEKEFYFAEGDCCLWSITEQEARKIMNSWGVEIQDMVFSVY